MAFKIAPIKQNSVTTDGFRERNTYVCFFFNCYVFEAGNMSEDLGEFNELSL